MRAPLCPCSLILFYPLQYFFIVSDLFVLSGIQFLRFRTFRDLQRRSKKSIFVSEFVFALLAWKKLPSCRWGSKVLASEKCCSSKEEDQLELSCWENLRAQKELETCHSVLDGTDRRFSLSFIQLGPFYQRVTMSIKDKGSGLRQLWLRDQTWAGVSSINSLASEAKAINPSSIAHNYFLTHWNAWF